MLSTGIHLNCTNAIGEPSRLNAYILKINNQVAPAGPLLGPQTAFYEDLRCVVGRAVHHAQGLHCKVNTG